MSDREKVINELRFQLDSKEVKEQHYSVQLSVSDAEKILAMLKEQRTTVEVVTVAKENGSVNFYAFNEPKDAIKCFCYWKNRGATVTCGEVDIQ